MLYDSGQGLTDAAKKWNEACEAWDGLAGTYGLQSGAAVIENVEGNWYEPDPDHDQSIVEWNNLVTGLGNLKSAAESELRAWKVVDPYGDTNAMGWDDMVPYLDGLNSVFLRVEVTPDTQLGGGHGTGTYWKAVGATTGSEYTGTVPDNTHGLNESARKGAASTVKNVAELYNDEIEAVLADVGWPAGVLA